MGQPHEAKQSQPDPKAGEGSLDLSWLLWVGVAIMLYLLSLGPAVKLHRAVPKSRPVIEAMYFWVEPLARSSPKFNAAAEWYVFNVWQVKR